MLNVSKVDAVVGNPPYIRQEKITEYYGKKYKEQLRKQVARDAPGTDLSGRSDIHCYFFTHALTFLSEGGYMGLLTSSTWLDTTYGFRLQKFLLDHFEIVAILESNCEPWFTGARVTTAATILRRQPDPEKRKANKVKFVQLTEPIAELLTYTQTEEERRRTIERLRDEIENAACTEEFSACLSGEPITVRQEHRHGMRVRIVGQDDLERIGHLSVGVSEADEESEGEEQEGSQPGNAATTGDYVGYKWGIFLRAPDIFFELLERSDGRFVPLGSVSDVKFGVKSGCDSFFFPRDITDEALQKYRTAEQFKEKYGISRRQTERIRIVHAVGEEVHYIEKQYLEKVVFNLMEIHSAEVDPDNLKKSILLVSNAKDQLRGTRVLRYIRWGEREGYDDRSTCASRETWYDLNPGRRGDLFWSMAQRYRHIVPLNTPDLICNHNLFDVFAPEGVPATTLAAVLNSTITALCKHQFGRTMGGDPMLKTEVVDVKMMLVPDPRLANEHVRMRLEHALSSMRTREIGHLVNVDSTDEGWTGDLAQPDRQELDDAVLELLGVRDPEERRKLRYEIYCEITKLYRAVRQAEKLMQRYRSETARKGRSTPHSIAAEIWEEIEEKPTVRTPLDFLSDVENDLIDLPEGKARVVHDLWDAGSLLVGKTEIPLGHPTRAAFAKALSDSRLHGLVSIPVDAEVCARAIKEHHEYERTMDEHFMDLASTRTADDSMQAKVVQQLWQLARKHSTS